MALSNRALLAAGSSVAVLAFVGVGAGASFSDNATATGSVTTGKVALSLTADGATYKSEGVTGDWLSTTGGGGNLRMERLSPMGSDFTASIPITIHNDGNLPINHWSLQVSDPNAENHLTQDTTVTFAANEKSVSLPLALVEHYASHGLPIPNNALDAVLGGHSIPGGGTFRLTVTFAPRSGASDVTGTYGNQDEGETMAPVFTVTGSDA